MHFSYQSTIFQIVVLTIHSEDHSDSPSPLMDLHRLNSQCTLKQICVDVCLVNSHAPFCKGGSIIYGDVMELRMVRPILIGHSLKQMQGLEHGPLEKWLSG